jgi:hypothetical protein
VVEWDNAQAKIVALFRTHGSQHVQASTLCVRSPSEFDFFRCLGKLTWTDDDTIQLTSRGGSESWTATRVVPH